jgi:predicted transglutaminase-like cysteine proteinase
MAMYDRDWYREGGGLGEQKSSYGDNQKISREDAEKLRKMFEGGTDRPSGPNEPPKVDFKYRHEVAGKSPKNEDEIERKVDELINSMDNRQKTNRANNRVNRFVKQVNNDTSETGTMIRIFGIMLLVAVVVVILSNWGEVKNLIQGRKFYTSIITQEQPTIPSGVIQKEYRLVEHITNDLAPILAEVAKTLEYNDVEGIGNWVYSESVTDAQLGSAIREMRNIRTINDQNNDSIINCTDFAILFYKLASGAGFDVKMMANIQLKHAFNAVRRIDGTWETIEPQAGNGGRIIMSNAWKNYDPAYDEEVTDEYRKYF